MFAFQIDRKSEAMQSLETIAKINTLDLHRKIAKSAEKSIKDSYIENWSKTYSATSPYRAYHAIKEMIANRMGSDMGFIRGVLTGSTRDAITGTWGAKSASVGLKGTWPSQGHGAYREELTTVFGSFGFDEFLKSEKGGGYSDEEYDRKFGGKDVQVNISSAGMEVLWPDEAQAWFNDMFFKSAPMATKKYGADWPGGGGGRQKDFMFLTDSQATSIFTNVSKYMNAILGIGPKAWLKFEEEEHKEWEKIQQKQIQAGLADYKGRQAQAPGKVSGKFPAAQRERKPAPGAREPSLTYRKLAGKRGVWLLGKPKKGAHVEVLFGGRYYNVLKFSTAELKKRIAEKRGYYSQWSTKRPKK